MTDHIQIGATAPRVQYTADGAQTSFPYPFPIFQDSDLDVYLDDEVQGSGFTVSGAGSSNGGVVSFTLAPDNAVLVTLRRNIAISRTADFQEGGALRAKVLNDELDRLTACLQQVESQLGRSLILSPVDPADNLVLPSLAARASAILGFDASGNPLAYDTTQFKGDKGAKGDKGDRGTDGAGAGDIVGPAVANDGNFVVFDGATGKLVADSGKSPGAFADATHAHAAADISDFTEAAQDVMGAMIAAAGGSYDDGAGTIDLPGGGVASETIAVFTSSGTWTKPAGLLWVEVIVTGGGGGGGGGDWAAGGGGGGAGATAIKRILAADLGSTETITVGSSTGTSMFGVHVSAAGGSNGEGYGVSGGAGGSGGVAGSSGDLNIDGGGGGGGTGYFTGYGAGKGGLGGASYWGGGAKGTSGSSVAGTVYGSGGAGSVSPSGGSGKSGIVVIREFKS